jgi:hypothetical protein
MPLTNEEKDSITTNLNIKQKDFIIGHLTKMLEMAEAEFGPRMQSIFLRKIVFSQAINTYYAEPGIIEISIQENVENDKPQCIYQLGQEIVHVLSMQNDKPVTCLEEGIATDFIERYMDSIRMGGIVSAPNNAHYQAKQKTQRLFLNYGKDLIKEIRKSKPIISSITAQDLIDKNPEIPSDFASEITSTFYK